MLLDLYKALFILGQYGLLVLVLRLEQSALMLSLGQPFALVLQLRLALPQDLLQLLLSMHGDLLQLLLFLAELSIDLVQLVLIVASSGGL